MPMHGLVIKNTGSWYTVKTDEDTIVNCKIKGNFRLKGIRSTNPVAVGDRVTIVMNNSGTAFITDIDDRRNYIIRKSSNLSKQSHIIAANVDQAVLVVTVDHPKTSTTFIDRFLASAEAYPFSWFLKVGGKRLTMSICTCPTPSNTSANCACGSLSLAVRVASYFVQPWALTAGNWLTTVSA